MTGALDTIRTATRDLVVVGTHGAELLTLPDAELVVLQRELSGLRRAVDSLLGLTAGAVAARSTREHGHAGLAQAQGFRSAEAFVQSVTGSTRAEASKLVRVGAVIAQAESSEWHAPLGLALAAGSLSIDAVDAIRRGLGEPDSTVTPSDLTDAAQRLIAAALSLDADQLYRRARDMRDDLDERGIALREKERHDQRYFRTHRRPDGMVGGSFLLAPEDGELVLGALDKILSPRRGGPRFTDPEDVAAADALVADPRTNDQLGADALVAMVRLAIDADPGTLFGKHRPAVRVIVTETSLQRRKHGYIEGASDAVSFETVERNLCDTGVLGIRVEGGRPLQLGRKRRFFSEAQRIAQAARDGGCLVGHCDRPPSQCESHHIDHWERDHGLTDVDDGVLLCRFHHMMLHNNGWKIRRQGARYWMVPPPSHSSREPIELFSKSRAWKEVEREPAPV